MTKKEIQQALNALDGPRGFTVTSLTPFYGNLADLADIPEGTGYYGTVRVQNTTSEPGICRLSALGPKGNGEANVAIEVLPAQHQYIGYTLFNKTEISNCAVYFTGYRIAYKYTPR